MRPSRSRGKAPATVQPKGRPLRFWFEGAELTGHEGEPLAVALWAAGIRNLGWQEDRNTPRGLYCGIGHCFECRLEINGVRDQRACLIPVRQGLRAHRQVPGPHLKAIPLEDDDE